MFNQASQSLSTGFGGLSDAASRTANTIMNTIQNNIQTGGLSPPGSPLVNRCPGPGQTYTYNPLYAAGMVGSGLILYARGTIDLTKTFYTEKGPTDVMPSGEGDLMMGPNPKYNLGSLIKGLGEDVRLAVGGAKLVYEGMGELGTDYREGWRPLC